jgi:error-prone DNA polymerase
MRDLRRQRSGCRECSACLRATHRDVLSAHFRLGRGCSEHYFLTVEDIVRYARMRGILLQGRGSAPLGRVLRARRDGSRSGPHGSVARAIHFQRAPRAPDIDIDFEHQRREEVMQYIYNKYGRHRAALAATVITYRRRMAIRDVARALGFPTDLTDALSKSIQWFDTGAEVPSQLLKLGFNPAAPVQIAAGLAYSALVGRAN